MEDKVWSHSFMDCCKIQGNVECIRELITAGADINKEDNYGQTPLLDCCEVQGHVECLKEVITAGADINKEESIMVKLL